MTQTTIDPSQANPIAPRRPTPGAPNPAAGTAAIAVALMGGVLLAMVLFADGPSWAVVFCGLLLAEGPLAAVYFLIDARPAPRRVPPLGPNRLPFCPYCGRPRRPTGAFCHTCGQRS